ncbi:MAG: prepilin-type N-terminal cleavage/methylation domain-containing protein [Fuerstiella sp.]
MITLRNNRQIAATGFRTGFTLIEMMVSVIIISMLMVAISSATDVYMQTATESFEEIERSQIARALLRNMSRDIRSATFVLKEVSDEEDDEESLDTEEVDPDTAMASYTDGLFGTEKDLVLYVSRPDADAIYVDAQLLQGGTDRSSDAMIIRYLLAESGGAGLAGMLADEAVANRNITDNAAGLGIMTGDMVGLSNAISMGDLETQMQASRLLAPEVADIRFSYFNGIEELPTWDSNLENSMPTAVIIEMTLRTIRPEWDERNPENTPGLLGPTVHRIVVPIPVSEPFVTETAI